MGWGAVIVFTLNGDRVSPAGNPADLSAAGNCYDDRVKAVEIRVSNRHEEIHHAWHGTLDEMHQVKEGPDLRRRQKSVLGHLR